MHKFKVGDLVHSRHPINIESAMVWKFDVEEDPEADTSDVGIIVEVQENRDNDLLMGVWYKVRWQKNSAHHAMLPEIELVKVADV